mgnify:CR=1 FL=1
MNSRFVTKQSQEIPVDYRLINRAGRWLVYDVIVEGVSLVSNYRTQFDKVIRTSSYPEMLRQLRDKKSPPASHPTVGPPRGAGPRDAL